MCVFVDDFDFSGASFPVHCICAQCIVLQVHIIDETSFRCRNNFGKIQPILAHNIIEKTLQQAYQITVSEDYLVNILYNIILMLLQA